MLTISQIAAIIMLLTAFGVDPITTADVQRILEGRPAITSTATTTTMTQAQPPATAPTKATPQAPSPTPASGVGTAEPVSLARIDIINPVATKGLNRPHSTSPELDQGGKGNPMNEIYIGAVVYGEDGEMTKSATVTVVVKSPTSEETSTREGTGAFVKPGVPFYPFTYVFKTAGDHTITFSSGDVSKSITVQVSE